MMAAVCKEAESSLDYHRLYQDVRAAASAEGKLEHTQAIAGAAVSSAANIGLLHYIEGECTTAPIQTRCNDSPAVMSHHPLLFGPPIAPLQTRS